MKQLFVKGKDYSMLKDVLINDISSIKHTKVRKSHWVSILAILYPTVALQRSKSSASVHGGGHIETPGSCTFNIHSIYLYPH